MVPFSIIIPVYNRPDEVKELLESLTHQTFKNFEVVVVEDGSSVRCEDIVNSYKNKLRISYHFKINEGRSLARNYGISRASGEYHLRFRLYYSGTVPDHRG